MTKDQAIARILNWAENEIGYLEKNSNAQLDSDTDNAGYNNYTKFANDIDKNYPTLLNGRKNGYAWCAMFVLDGFVRCFGLADMMKMLYLSPKCDAAGCTEGARYYQKKSALYTSPQAGDQVFFSNDDWATSYHTGIVKSVSGSTVVTIEGNTSSKAGVVPNGGGVFQKVYTLNSGMKFGRPDWKVVADAGSVTPESPTFAEPVVTKPAAKQRVVLSKDDSAKNGVKLKVVNCYFLNVRDVNANIIDQLQAGELVMYYGYSAERFHDFPGKWYCVVAHGKTGYVSGKYVSRAE